MITEFVESKLAEYSESEFESAAHAALFVLQGGNHTKYNAISASDLTVIVMAIYPKLGRKGKTPKATLTSELITDHRVVDKVCSVGGYVWLKNN